MRKLLDVLFPYEPHVDLDYSSESKVNHRDNIVLDVEDSVDNVDFELVPYKTFYIDAKFNQAETFIGSNCILDGCLAHFDWKTDGMPIYYNRVMSLLESNGELKRFPYATQIEVDGLLRTVEDIEARNKDMEDGITLVAHLINYMTDGFREDEQLPKLCFCFLMTLCAFNIDSLAHLLNQNETNSKESMEHLKFLFLAMYHYAYDRSTERKNFSESHISANSFYLNEEVMSVGEKLFMSMPSVFRLYSVIISPVIRKTIMDNKVRSRVYVHVEDNKHISHNKKVAVSAILMDVVNDKSLIRVSRIKDYACYLQDLFAKYLYLMNQDLFTMQSLRMKRAETFLYVFDMYKMFKPENPIAPFMRSLGLIPSEESGTMKLSVSFKLQSKTYAFHYEDDKRVSRVIAEGAYCKADLDPNYYSSDFTHCTIKSPLNREFIIFSKKIKTASSIKAFNQDAINLFRKLKSQEGIKIFTDIVSICAYSNWKRAYEAFVRLGFVKYEKNQVVSLGQEQGFTTSSTGNHVTQKDCLVFYVHSTKQSMDHLCRIVKTGFDNQTTYSYGNYCFYCVYLEPLLLLYIKGLKEKESQNNG